MKTLICLFLIQGLPSNAFALKKCTSFSQQVGANISSKKVGAKFKTGDLVDHYLNSIKGLRLLTREEEVEIAKAREDASISIMIALQNKRDLFHVLALRTLKSAGQTENPLFKKCIDLLETDMSVLEIIEELSQSDLDFAHFTNFFVLEAETFGDYDSQTRKQLEPLFSKAKKFRNELAKANLRLVISIAKRFRNRGVSFIDLISFGNHGLMEAVDRWEYMRGYKFGTYATYWIRRYIQNETVRLHRRRQPVSIDAPNRKTDDGKSNASLVEDKSTPPSDSALEKNETRRIFMNKVRGLVTDKEWDVIEARYGLNGHTPMKFETLARLHKVKKQAVQQMEARGMAKIRLYFQLHPDELTVNLFEPIRNLED